MVHGVAKSWTQLSMHVLELFARYGQGEAGPSSQAYPEGNCLWCRFSVKALSLETRSTWG